MLRSSRSCCAALRAGGLGAGKVKIDILGPMAFAQGENHGGGRRARRATRFNGAAHSVSAARKRQVEAGPRRHERDSSRHRRDHSHGARDHQRQADLVIEASGYEECSRCRKSRWTTRGLLGWGRGPKRTGLLRQT